MLKERLLQYAESIVKRATYTINGEEKEGTIGKVTRSGDSFTFILMMKPTERSQTPNYTMSITNFWKARIITPRRTHWQPQPLASE